MPKHWRVLVLGGLIVLVGVSQSAEAWGRRRERGQAVPRPAKPAEVAAAPPAVVVNKPVAPPSVAESEKPAPAAAAEMDPRWTELARIRQQVGSPFSGATLSGWASDAGPNFAETLNRVAQTGAAQEEEKPVASEAAAESPTEGAKPPAIVSTAAVLRAAAKELTQRFVEAEEAGDYPRADSLRKLANGLWQEARLAADGNSAAAR